MTVAEMLARMSSAELSEWMVYNEIEPISPQRQDRQAATIAYVVAEGNRNPKKRPRRYKVDDFMPKYGFARTGNWESVLAKAQAYQSLHGSDEEHGDDWQFDS